MCNNISMEETQLFRMVIKTSFASTLEVAVLVVFMPLSNLFSVSVMLTLIRVEQIIADSKSIIRSFFVCDWNVSFWWGLKANLSLKQTLYRLLLRNRLILVVDGHGTVGNSGMSNVGADIGNDGLS